MNPHESPFAFIDNLGRLTQSLQVTSQMEALTRTDELLRSHCSELNAVAEAMRAGVESQVFAATAAEEAIREGVQPLLSAATAAEEAIREGVQPLRSAAIAAEEAIRSQLDPVIEALRESSMFRDLERMAEQQQAFTADLMKPLRVLEEMNRSLFGNLDEMRTAYDAISQSILKVDRSVVSSAADCAVAYAHGEIELSVTEGDDGDIELHDAKGVLDPIVKDLKKSPAFFPLVFYAGMLLTALTMSVVPNDRQQQAKEILKVLCGGSGAIVVLGKLTESWEKMSKKDDEV